VVPTNTIDKFEEHTIDHGDYKVFIVAATRSSRSS
jgi:hypothetical protein